MAQVTKDMVISDIISINEGVIPILLKAGMHCANCPSARSETLGEAGFVHGQDVDKLVDEINGFLSA